MSEERKGRNLTDSEIKTLDVLVKFGFLNYSKPDNCYFHYNRHEVILTVIDFLLHPIVEVKDEDEY
jgi:hypothetical protein